MRIEKEDNKMHFKIENNTIGKIEDEIDIEMNKRGEKSIAISIFPPYILRAATEINLKNTLHIKINERQKPILFCSKEEAKTMYYIVMPMIGV